MPNWLRATTRRTPTALLTNAIVVVTLAAVTVTACSSEDQPQPSTVNTILPDPTVPAPGDCDLDAEALSTPSIVIAGTAADATFGVGSYECGTLTGDGYIVFAYNPILLDAAGPIEVVVDADDVPTFTWAGNGPFVESSPGRWTSPEPAAGCARLTIDLASPSGLSTATYGADIRVGGASVSCPQRTLSPDDPTDTTPIPTGPLDPGLDTIPSAIPPVATDPLTPTTTAP